VAQLRQGHDRTNEIDEDRLGRSPLALTDRSAEARGADIYIVTVPTPVDGATGPTSAPLIAATETVAGLIDPARRADHRLRKHRLSRRHRGDLRPEIERASGLERGRDFRLGYSPERINPGDREHTVDKIVKVVAGETRRCSSSWRRSTARMTSGGVFRAASIKTAEAAKVIENAQRDINIAFMNEVTQIFSKLDLSIWDVLAAARTKWNFLRLRAGAGRRPLHRRRSLLSQPFSRSSSATTRR
jgi:UDP-N-acetyl-D-galactosamine dehydrogenase